MFVLHHQRSGLDKDGVLGPGLEARQQDPGVRVSILSQLHIHHSPAVGATAVLALVLCDVLVRSAKRKLTINRWVSATLLKTPLIAISCGGGGASITRRNATGVPHMYVAFKQTRATQEDVRLFEVDDEADEVSVVGRSVPLPGQLDPCAAGAIGRKRKDGAFTCGNHSCSHSSAFHLSSSESEAEAAPTAGSVAVVAEFALVKAALDARLLPHLVDLGHAQLGVGAEKQLSRLDCEVVLGPVPQILELMVIKGGEGIHAGDKQQRTQRERQQRG